MNSKDLLSQVELANAELDLTNELLESICRVLKSQVKVKLKWNTTSQVAKSLRYILDMRRRWLELRNRFTNCYELCCSMNDKLEAECQVSGSSNWKRQSRRDGQQVVKAKQLVVQCPSPKNYDAYYEIMKRFTKLCEEVDSYYWQANMLCQPEDYMTIKKLMPKGGRDAYSACMAAAHGILTQSLPAQNCLFGWNGKYEKAGRNLRRLARAISGREKEPRGPAPSLKAGQELLLATTFETQKTVKWHTSWNARSDLVRRRHHLLIKNNTLCGDEEQAMPTMVRYIARTEEASGTKHHKLQQWIKLCRKVMGIELERANGQVIGRVANDVLTVLTGPPVHLHGADYYAPVMYTVSKGRSLPAGEVEGKTEQGYILMRQNWPDMFHVASKKLPMETMVISDRNELIAEVSRTLDQASRSYFARKLEEAKRKLTSQQRFANMVRTLRALKYVAFMRGDSYSVGNCVPGTEAFIDRLRISKDADAAIPGPGMAWLWYKADYPQPDRFQSVIDLMVTKQEAYLQKCYDAMAAIFPVETPSVTDEQLHPPAIPFAVPVATGLDSQYEPFPPPGFNITGTNNGPADMSIERG